MAVGGAGASIRSILSGKVTVNLLVSSADLITVFGAGAKIYLERDTTSAFAAPTVATSTALVSGTEQIELADTSGTSASWYRVRIGNTGGTTYGDYSDGVQATSLLAYASLDELLRTMDVVTSDTRRLAVLADMLIDSADLLNQLCDRDFYRHPQVSGTETRVYHITRSSRYLTHAIEQAIDIVSITTMEISSSVSGAYSTVAAGATGYFLLPEYPKRGFPYEEVLLSPEGASYTTFPVGGLVRLTLAAGWSAVPSMARRANIDLARESYRQGPGGGGPVGINQFGTPVFGPGTPDSVVKLYKSDYKRRSFVNA